MCYFRDELSFCRQHHIVDDNFSNDIRAERWDFKKDYKSDRQTQAHTQRRASNYFYTFGIIKENDEWFTDSDNMTSFRRTQRGTKNTRLITCQLNNNDNGSTKKNTMSITWRKMWFFVCNERNTACSGNSGMSWIGNPIGLNGFGILQQWSKIAFNSTVWEDSGDVSTSSVQSIPQSSYSALYYECEAFRFRCVVRILARCHRSL